MDEVEREPERVDEVALEQAVMPDHLERQPVPSLAERDAVVRLVRDEAELREALQHAGDGGRGHGEALSERAGGRAAGLDFELVDRLRVVLDRLAELHSPKL